MRHMLGIKMEVFCNTADVLNKVKENRTEHAQIVEEARKGFIEKAKALLEEKLSLLKEGKLTTLQVNLSPPQNYTAEYDTIIQMLSMHTEKEITLGADEVRMFIEDRWDWTEAFLATNSAYSGSAIRKSVGMFG